MATNKQQHVVVLSAAEIKNGNVDQATARAASAWGQNRPKDILLSEDTESDKWHTS